MLVHDSLWRRAYAQNVRLRFPYRQNTNNFIFLFVSEHCQRSALRLFSLTIVYLEYVIVCARQNACPWFGAKCCKTSFRLSSVVHIHQNDNLTSVACRKGKGFFKILPNPGGNICCQQHVIIKYLPHVAKQILILETLDKECRSIES